MLKEGAGRKWSQPLLSNKMSKSKNNYEEEEERSIVPRINADVEKKKDNVRGT